MFLHLYLQYQNQFFIKKNYLLVILFLQKTVVRSCPFVDVSNSQATMENREGHPLIVICVHPQQSALVSLFIRIMILISIFRYF